MGAKTFCKCTSSRSLDISNCAEQVAKLELEPKKEQHRSRIHEDQAKDEKKERFASRRLKASYTKPTLFS